jgi:hypothetical protein
MSRAVPGLEKGFAEKEGASYGTPAGSIMCTTALEAACGTADPGSGRRWSPKPRS